MVFAAFVCPYLNPPHEATEPLFTCDTSLAPPAFAPGVPLDQTGIQRRPNSHLAPECGNTDDTIVVHLMGLQRTVVAACLDNGVA